MTTLMTYDPPSSRTLRRVTGSARSAALAFSADSSEYFSFSPDGIGSYKATAKVRIGRFKKGSWLRTCIDTTAGMPRIQRSCSMGDSAIVKKYVPDFFN